MPVLPITVSEVLQTARLPVTDLASQIDAQNIIGLEQEAIEQTLAVNTLVDSSIHALLRRNVTKLIAAELIEQIGREEGRSEAFTGVGLTLAKAVDHAGVLRTEARLALAPYLRHRGTAQSPALPSPASHIQQAALLGALEVDRVGTMGGLRVPGSTGPFRDG